MDLAACPLVTQACWSSPTHNASSNSGFQKHSPSPKALSNTSAVLAIRSVQTPCLLATSSALNLKPSDPGQATSPVWVLEKEVLNSWFHPLGKAVILHGHCSALPQDQETLGQETSSFHFLTLPDIQQTALGLKAFHSSELRPIPLFHRKVCCPPSLRLSRPLNPSEC